MLEDRDIWVLALAFAGPVPRENEFLLIMLDRQVLTDPPVCQR
jgi:hypothetical protein